MIIIHSEEEMKDFASKEAKLAKVGDIICLEGDLGVGKTVFAKAFAKTLSIEETITSPTFQIIKEYVGSSHLFHFDFYRIHQQEEVESLDLDSFFYGKGICLIEWASRIKDFIPKKAKWIVIQRHETKDNWRTIQIQEEN